MDIVSPALPKSILRIALLFGILYGLPEFSVAYAQIGGEYVGEANTEDMSNIDLYLFNFDNRLDFRIPKAFMNYVGNWRGDSQTFIRLGLSLSKLLQLNENSAMTLDLSMAKPLAKDDFIQIHIQVPARTGGIDKVFEYTESHSKFDLIDGDLFGLEVYKVETDKDRDLGVVWLRPIDKKNYSDIYFESISGLDRKFPYTENMIVDGHVRVKAIYYASYIERWRDVDSAVRKLIRRLIIKGE